MKISAELYDYEHKLDFNSLNDDGMFRVFRETHDREIIDKFFPLKEFNKSIPPAKQIMHECPDFLYSQYKEGVSNFI